MAWNRTWFGEPGIDDRLAMDFRMRTNDQIGRRVDRFQPPQKAEYVKYLKPSPINSIGPPVRRTKLRFSPGVSGLTIW